MTRPRTRLLREERDMPLEVEARDGADGRPVIDGYALRYGVWSLDLGGFRERIMPGAATRTIGEADIRGLINHEPSLLLGRNKAGTMDLTDPGDGIRNVIRPEDTSYARDLVLNMRAGNIDQQSFAFRVPGRLTDRNEPAEIWRSPSDPDIVKRDGLWERDVLELILFDTSIVTYPAYVRSKAHVRSAQAHLREFGLDPTALSDIFLKAERGLSLTETDIAAINASITVLRSYVDPAPPSDAPAEGEDVTRGDAAIAEAPDAPAGREVAHLRRTLDARLRAAGLHTAG